MQIVKDPLTEAVLRANIESSEPVFSEQEMGFLGQYAPHIVTPESIDELLKEENGRLGINQTVFSIVVRMDRGVYRGDDLERQAHKQASEINPLLSGLGIEAVVVEPDPIQTLYQVKIRGLEALKRTMHNHFGGGVDVAPRNEERGRFPQERTELCEIFKDPDLPIFVYGSYFRGEDNGRDIDVMVFPKVLTEEMYGGLRGKMDTERKPELSIAIVPRDYAYWFALSDSANVLAPGESAMINGELPVPILDEQYVNLLKIYKAASNLIRLRKALTREGIEDCKDKIGRINSYCKAPRFAYQDLALAATPAFPNPDVRLFQSLPPIDKIVEALVHVNLQMYNMLVAYQRGIQVLTH